MPPQGGDVTRDREGRYGHSALGAITFDDENFKIKHTGNRQSPPVTAKPCQ
jgi:hypothetical protein